MEDMRSVTFYLQRRFLKLKSKHGLKIMTALPDINQDYVVSADIRIIQTSNFNLRGRILPKYPEDIMAFYYAARTRVKRMEIDQDRHAKKSKKTYEEWLDTWGAEAANYIRTSYEKDAAMMIKAFPNVSIADVKGVIYEKHWSNREYRELTVSQVLASNGKVLLIDKGESVIPDMEPKPLSFFRKIFGR